MRSKDGKKPQARPPAKAPENWRSKDKKTLSKVPKVDLPYTRHFSVALAKKNDPAGFRWLTGSSHGSTCSMQFLGPRPMFPFGSTPSLLWSLLGRSSVPGT